MEYFELEFENNQIFMGEVNQETEEYGPVGILQKDNGKHLVIAQIKNVDGDFEFTGYGMMLNVLELTIYRGQILDTQKHGFGHLIKFKQALDMTNQQIGGFNEPENFLKKVNKQSFNQLVDQVI